MCIRDSVWMGHCDSPTLLPGPGTLGFSSFHQIEGVLGWTAIFGRWGGHGAVSYTHLDVYKRQVLCANTGSSNTHRQIYVTHRQRDRHNVSLSTHFMQILDYVCILLPCLGFFGDYFNVIHLPGAIYYGIFPVLFVLLAAILTPTLSLLIAALLNTSFLTRPLGVSTLSLIHI